MKRKKLNRIDVVLVVLLLAALFLYGWHMYGERLQRVRNNAHDVRIDVTIDVDAVREGYRDHIRVGDAVTDASGSYIGSVADVSFRELTAELSEGKEAVYPGYRRMTVTCRCDALYDGNTYRIGERTVVVGETYELAVPQLLFSGICTAVKQTETP